MRGHVGQSQAQGDADPLPCGQVEQLVATQDLGDCEVEGRGTVGPVKTRCGGDRGSRYQPGRAPAVEPNSRVRCPASRRAAGFRPPQIQSP